MTSEVRELLTGMGREEAGLNKVDDGTMDNSIRLRVVGFLRGALLILCKLRKETRRAVHDSIETINFERHDLWFQGHV